MQRLSQIKEMKSIGRTISFSLHRVTVDGVIGRSTVTDGPSTKHRQPIFYLRQSEGVEKKMNLSNDKECGIQGYNINDVPKSIDTNSTSNKSTPAKHKDWKFKALLSSDAVKPSKQAASQCKELTFTASTIANNK